MQKLLSILTFLLHLQGSAQACTTTAYLSESDDLFVGKSLDWNLVHGFVSVNPKGAQKRGLLLPGTSAQPIQWKAKYGSVTFDQVARNFPFGGMNQEGLMIEVMWLNETSPPPLKNDIPAINESQYMQYLLDQASSVAAAVELTKGIQVQKGAAPIHYLMCDKIRECAIVEFVSGERKIYRSSDDSMPYKALTNNNYPDSLAFLKRFIGFGGSQSIPYGNSGSPSRFVIAIAESEKRNDPRDSRGRPDPVSKGFKILEKVMAPNTAWQIVYDPAHEKISFRSRDSLAIKSVDLRQFKFDCNQGYLYHRINQGSGDVSGQFEKITNVVSDEHIDKSSFIPANLRPLLKQYDRASPMDCSAPRSPASAPASTVRKASPAGRQ